MADASQGGAQGGSQVSRLQQAYQRMFAQLQAVDADELLPITLDVGSVYTLGTGALLKVAPYRAQIAELPEIKQELVANAEDLLLTLGHTQALFIAATAPVASVPELFAQLIKTREIMVADANALAKRDLVPEQKLRELRGPTGHSATSFDVLALCALLRANWANIEGKTALQLSDLEQAETLADRLLSAVGERSVSDEQASVASQQRQRAFTLFMRAYDELRRAVTYIRWHEGDADEITPSLYTTRNARRRRSDDAVTEAESPAFSLPSATNGTPAAAAEAAVDGSPFV